MLLNSSNGTTHTYVVKNLQSKLGLDVIADVQNLVSSNTQKHKGFLTGSITLATKFKAGNQVLGFSSDNKLFQYELVAGQGHTLDDDQAE